MGGGKGLNWDSGGKLITMSKLTHRNKLLMYLYCLSVSYHLHSSSPSNIILSTDTADRNTGSDI